MELFINIACYVVAFLLIGLMLYLCVLMIVGVTLALWYEHVRWQELKNDLRLIAEKEFDPETHFLARARRGAGRVKRGLALLRKARTGGRDSKQGNCA
jgi:hypothetical protein